MSLETPLITIIEDSLPTLSSEEDRAELSRILKDTRSEYKKIQEEITSTEAEQVKKQNFKDSVPRENHKEHEELWMEIYYMKEHIENLKQAANLVRPLSLSDLDYCFSHDEYNRLNSYFYERQLVERYTSIQDIEKGFTNHPQFLGFRRSKPNHLGKRRIQKARHNELLLHEIIRLFLEKSDIQCLNLEKFLLHRKEVLDLFWADKETRQLRLFEMPSCKELKSNVKHFAWSKERNEYFEKLKSLASSKEEIFYVVQHAHNCPCWPKAVRRLAKIKDLSPIEKIK